MGGPGSGRRPKLSEVALVEVRRRVAGGERVDVVAFEMGVSVRTIFRVIAKAGGVPPRSATTSDRYLILADRIQIEVGLRCGDKANVIAVRLGRSPSTISREVSANGGRDNYQAFAAERRAHQRRARPKAEKLALNPRLRAAVEYMLEQHLSPEQISGRLPLEFPDDEEMRVSAETIYQSLFVQGRGALRKELISCLRSGRAQRRPHGRLRRDGVGSKPW